jgi:hypothetical protein
LGQFFLLGLTVNPPLTENIVCLGVEYFIRLETIYRETIIEFVQDLIARRNGQISQESLDGEISSITAATSKPTAPHILRERRASGLGQVGPFNPGDRS